VISLSGVHCFSVCVCVGGGLKSFTLKLTLPLPPCFEYYLPLTPIYLAKRITPISTPNRKDNVEFVFCLNPVLISSSKC
jgi:hypothetical protein